MAKLIDENERVAAYQLMEDMHPELWRKCYPRIYSTPNCGTYYSPKEPARQLMGISMKIAASMIGKSEQYEFLLASNLARFGVPIFWIGRDMTEAIRHTSPPGELDWYNMPLPFEAMVFMLPKGALVHPEEGDVVFVAYSRLKAGERHMSLLVPGHPYASLNGGMTFLAYTDSGYLTHWNVPLNDYGPRLSLPDLDRLMLQYSTNEHSTAFWSGDNPPHMTPADDWLGIEVAHLVFGTILLMEDRPDLVTRGALQKRVPAKRGKSVREFWSPNIVGESYRIRREPAEPQGGHHASPRMHWVRGSYRNQPIGPRVEQRSKRIWIEPYTRGI